MSKDTCGKTCIFHIWVLIKSEAGLPLKIDEWCTHPMREMNTLPESGECPHYVICEEDEDQTT